MTKGITYKDAGVDIDQAEEGLSLAKQKIVATLNSSVLRSIGSFGAMYDLSEILKNYKHPILVQSIDGVGTKLMIANMAGSHKTVGIDLVAHSCNDILCQGAKAITFMDYIAADKLTPSHIEEVISGICEGCMEAGLPLVGGETAEMPGVYKIGEYDLAGCITGVVEKDKAVTGKDIKEGDILLGLASDGLHTNGYSLARKVLFDMKKYTVNTYIKELGTTLGEELLRPHKNYAPSVLPLIDKSILKGIAHITGGGLYGNIPRVLPKGLYISINKNSWDTLPIFDIIQKEGAVPENDMLRAFNLGIGLVLILAEKDADTILNHMKDFNIKVFRIGEVIRQEK